MVKLYDVAANLAKTTYVYVQLEKRCIVITKIILTSTFKRERVFLFIQN